MNKREIAQLACKILAVWFFCQVATNLYGIVMFLIFPILQLFGGHASAPDFAGALVGALLAIGPLIIGILLWWKSGRIATKMASDDPVPVTSGSLDQKSVLAIAFVVVGALLAVNTLPQFGRTLYVIVRDNASFSEHWVSKEFQAKFLSDVFQLLLAFWLIFGSKGIAGMIRQFRARGESHYSQDGENGNSSPTEDGKH